MKRSFLTLAIKIQISLQSRQTRHWAHYRNSAEKDLFLRRYATPVTHALKYKQICLPTLHSLENSSHQPQRVRKISNMPSVLSPSFQMPHWIIHASKSEIFTFYRTWCNSQSIYYQSAFMTLLIIIYMIGYHFAKVIWILTDKAK